MKKIILSVALALLMGCGAWAQDSRNRLSSTIVADVLAQMPAKNQTIFNQAMSDLASTGSEGVVQMAEMLVPAGQGKNASIEYALSGLAGYVFAPGREKERISVRAGLKEALAKCKDNDNKAFLLTLLQRVGTAEDAPVFAGLVSDPYLQEWALNGLIAIPGTEEALLEVMKSGIAPRDVLAYAAGKKGLTTAEPLLVEWRTDANDTEKRAFNKALSEVGSATSLPLLAKAAKEQNYEWTPDGATECYVRLMERVAESPDKEKAISAAKTLLKATDKAHVRGAAMDVLFKAQGKKALPLLLTALKDDDRAIRVNALRSSEPWADEAVFAAIGKIAGAKGSAPVKEDVINWLGTNHAVSQLPVVIANIKNTDSAIAESAIKAASKLGTPVALHALAEELDGIHSDIAVKALLSFPGSVDEAVATGLKGGVTAQKAALGIASARKMKSFSPQVFALLQSSEPAVAQAAADALAGVVTAEDFNTLTGLLENVPSGQLAGVNSALLSSLSQKSGEEQYEMLKPKVASSKKASLYYPALAQAGVPEAVTILEEAYLNGSGEKREKALAALLTVEGRPMINRLSALADKGDTDKILTRYAQLVDRSGYSNERKLPLYAKALTLTETPAVRNQLLKGLSTTGLYQAILEAMPYMDDPSTQRQAAATVRTVATKILDRFKGGEMKNALLKARDIYKSGTTADDGYAVDDINGMLARIDAAPPSPIFKLSAEEEAEGFRVLFDGTNLDNFTGNKTGYIPIDGNIYVTAAYGDEGNLYTNDEFSDFIFRFEFCFETEGVNNGIGIRTPMGVDAAYHGMEIQVLDHDAPIYKGLRDYQVHGSVYGVIPAKRLVHKPLGEWSTEEIRAVGDHITVTVNGEVILDGNIREACEGHNVSPDGEQKNPYTVDHQNHPGLFNKKGHIGFLGHGEGVKFRNVRVKDLSQPTLNKKKKK